MDGEMEEELEFSPSESDKFTRICKEGLGKECMDFIIENIQIVTASQNFQDQIQVHPDLVMPILQKAAEKMPDNPPTIMQRAEQRAKKSRRSGPAK